MMRSVLVVMRMMMVMSVRVVVMMVVVVDLGGVALVLRGRVGTGVAGG